MSFFYFNIRSYFALATFLWSVSNTEFLSNIQTFQTFQTSEKPIFSCHLLVFTMFNVYMNYIIFFFFGPTNSIDRQDVCESNTTDRNTFVVLPKRAPSSMIYRSFCDVGKVSSRRKIHCRHPLFIKALPSVVSNTFRQTPYALETTYVVCLRPYPIF